MPAARRKKQTHCHVPPEPSVRAKAKRSIRICTTLKTVGNDQQKECEFHHDNAQTTHTATQHMLKEFGSEVLKHPPALILYPHIFTCFEFVKETAILRPAHPVWSDFNIIAKIGNKGKWDQCKKCKKELQDVRWHWGLFSTWPIYWTTDFWVNHLTDDQRDKVFGEMQSDNIPPTVTALLTQSSMFPKYLFGSQFEQTPPMERWKLLDMNTNDPRWLNCVNKNIIEETEVDWNWEPDDDVPLVDLRLRPDPE
ncbi:hypothetical protein EVAR_22478_1 [Eumeta japonica]|uniref:Mariner Mos1 transposase n=1 Tax=Eumeta variegata TaxID=151549 RepID=A0A4C1VC35_EUMVA|nr:hypothetical protein EVAR_22478_1 [Eumeta japonica]